MTSFLYQSVFIIVVLYSLMYSVPLGGFSKVWESCQQGFSIQLETFITENWKRTGGVQLECCGHLQGRESLTNDTIKVHYGNSRLCPFRSSWIQYFLYKSTWKQNYRLQTHFILLYYSNDNYPGIWSFFKMLFENNILYHLKQCSLKPLKSFFQILTVNIQD